MNIFRTFVFIIISFSNIYAQKTTKVFFKIDGYTEGGAQLVGVFGDANYLADSARIQKDGGISFSNPKGYTDGLFYLLLPDQTNFQFLIANGENPTISAQKGDYVNSLRAQNSQENELFFDNQRLQVRIEQKFNGIGQELRKYAPNSSQYNELRKQQQQLIDERDAAIAVLKEKYLNTLFTKFKLAGQNPRLRYTYRADGILDSSQTMINYRDDWWNDFDFTDKRLLHTPVFFNKLKKHIMELTTQHPDSVIKSAVAVIDKAIINKDFFNFATNWITYEFKPGKGKLMDSDAVYAYLILKYFTPENAQALGQSAADIESMRRTAKEMQCSLIGMIGQDVKAQDSKGVIKSIYGLNTPLTVIFIYNPECEHCQEETPHLKAVYDEWKNKGVGFYSIVANAKSKEEWQNFVRKYGVTWTDVWDPELKSRYHEKYYVDITPECYVLDKNHKIIAKNLKAHQLPEVFRRELAKMK